MIKDWWSFESFLFYILCLSTNESLVMSQKENLTYESSAASFFAALSLAFSIWWIYFHTGGPSDWMAIYYKGFLYILFIGVAHVSIFYISTLYKQYYHPTWSFFFLKFVILIIISFSAFLTFILIMTFDCETTGTGSQTQRLKLWLKFSIGSRNNDG